MTSTLTVAGHLAAHPVISYTPRDHLAVVRMTILAQPDLRGFGTGRPAEPIEYPVKAVGQMAQHAYDSLSPHDRVIVVGSQCAEVSRDPLTGERTTTIWLYAQEIGASFARTAVRVLPAVDAQAVRAVRLHAVPTPAPELTTAA